jgi:predicted transport protein
MRHYLTAKTGEIPNVREVYSAFKGFAPRFKGDTQNLVADIHAFASYYCAIALGAETVPTLKQAFQDLRELRVDVSYPFLLEVYHDFKQGRLSVDEVVQVVRLVESYVVRRAICARPTNSLNKTFAGLGKKLKKDRYLESVQAAFMLLPSYRRLPSDDEFLRDIQVRDLYSFRSRSYWLRRLENHGRKERVMVEDYTIEHILPQNEMLSKAWQSELGEDWQRIQQAYLHTLGNLTLTGYNSEYSDRPFAYKRDQVTDKDGHPVGLKHSPLRLNLGLGTVAEWNEDAIRARANRLANEALKVWTMPNLSKDVLNAYRNDSVKSIHQYGIDQHPHLAVSPVREIFQALRQAIQDLDACVTEEFLKLYVAYKAETNFVDVIPQAKRLLLVLNVSIADIEDAKGLCRDISGIGRWGNGNVEVGLGSLDELPYVMNLVRQSFEHQMGGLQDS